MDWLKAGVLDMRIDSHGVETDLLHRMVILDLDRQAYTSNNLDATLEEVRIELARRLLGSHAQRRLKFLFQRFYRPLLYPEQCLPKHGGFRPPVSDLRTSNTIDQTYRHKKLSSFSSHLP